MRITGYPIAAIVLAAFLFGFAAHARVKAYTFATERFPNMLDDTPPCEKAYQEYLYMEKELKTCTPYKAQCPSANQVDRLKQRLYDKEKKVCDKCQNEWPGGPKPYGRQPCK